MSLRDFLTDLNNRKDNDELDRLIISLASPDLHSAGPALYQLSRSDHPEVVARLLAVLSILDFANNDDFDRNVITDGQMCNRIVHVLSRCGSKALPALITVLKHDHGLMKQVAVRAIGLIKNSDAIEPLYQALNKADDDLRYMIVSALKWVGAKEILIKLTHHEDEDVRMWAVYALGSQQYIKDEQAVAAIKDALDDPSDRVREMAVRVLGRPENKSAVASILPRLLDKSYQVRFSAALALRDIGDPSAAKALLNALRKYPSLLRGGVMTLGAMGDPRGVDVLIGALTNEDPHIRLGAVRSLGQLGNIRAVKPLVVLLQREQDLLTRQATIEALGMLGDQSVVDLLITLLNDDSSVAYSAATALGRLGGSKAVETLREFVSDQKRVYSSVWLGACSALKLLHEPAPPALFTMLDDTSFFERSDVAAGLGAIGDQQAVPPLLAALALPEPTETTQIVAVLQLRQEAIRSLGLLGVGLGILTTVLLEDWDHEVRRIAAEVLEDLGDRQAVPALIAALKDPHPEVRAEAASALGQLGDPQAIPALQILADEDQGYIEECEFIDEIAAYAIRQINSRFAP